MTFPRLVLRDEVADLLDLPWEQPLGSLGRHRPPLPRAAGRPVAASRPVPRRRTGSSTRSRSCPTRSPSASTPCCATSRTPGCPSVRAVGLAARPDRGDAILVTEYLRHSMQYRRLLMLLRPGSAGYRDRLLDAMALLLVDLHRGGVYWGDCSLANTLFRRDGDRIQAYLVDAETSETFPSLSDGQRGVRPRDPRRERRLRPRRPRRLPRPRGGHGRGDRRRRSPSGRGYEAVWSELHDQPEMIPGDRQAIRARLRRLNDLGFSVDLEVDPVGPHGRRAAADLRDHAPLPRERAGAADAASGRSRARRGSCSTTWPSTRRGWSSTSAGRSLPEEAADRWLREVYRPTQARIAGIVGPRPGPRPGLLRRPRAQVAAVRAGRPRRRARGGDRVLPGRGRPGARAARAARPPTARSRAGRARPRAMDCPARPGSPRSTTRGSRAELSPPSARGARARRAAAGRRPCWGR